jgi:hypothetical protein
MVSEGQFNLVAGNPSWVQSPGIFTGNKNGCRSSLFFSTTGGVKIAFQSCMYLFTDNRDVKKVNFLTRNA